MNCCPIKSCCICCSPCEGEELSTKNCRKSYLKDLHLYIEKDGNDANDGLSPKTAFATFAKVQSVMRMIDMHGNNLYINYGAGTFAEFIVLDKQHECFANKIYVQGLVVNGKLLTRIERESGTLVNIITITNVVIKDFYLKSVYSENQTVSVCIRALGKAFVYLEGTIILEGAATGIWVGNFSTVAINATLHFNGKYTLGIKAHNQSLVFGNGFLVYNNPQFSLENIQVSTSSLAELMNCTITGTAIGRRFQVNTGGAIVARPKGQNYIPGTVAGSIESATYGYYTD